MIGCGSLVAITIPWWALGRSPTETVGDRLQSPSWSHLLGTDTLGRDVFMRTLYGARDSLPATAAVIVLTALIGSVLAPFAGFRGGIVDSVVMRVSDVVLAFPPIFLAMAVAAALGPGLRNTVIAVVLVWWPFYARLLRGQVLTIKHREHVEAAASVGVTQAAHPAPPRAADGVHAGADQRHDGLRPGRDPHRVAELPRPRRHAAVARVGR